MKKIKLCRIIYEFPPRIGGSVTHTLEIAKHMAPYCEQQFFIVPKVEEDTTVLDASFPYNISRVKYIEFKTLKYLKSKFLKWLPLYPLITFSFWFASAKQCLRLNKDHNIDIIHTHGMNPFAVIIGKIIQKPVVWMMHGTNEHYSKISGLYESFTTKVFHPDHILVLDDGSRAPEKFHKILKENLVTTVHYAIDTEFYCPKNRNTVICDNLGLNNTFNIMVIQNLHPIKGVNFSIQAFSEFMKLINNDRARLIIIGDGVLRKNLEMMSADLHLTDKILFLGSIPNTNIPDYLSIADVVISTSTYSNMNRSLHETLSCGKPVISFDSGNIDHTIINGYNGILVKSGDVYQLASKIFELYLSPLLREELGNNARKYCKEYRQWTNRIDAELKVYELLLTRRGK